MPPEENDFLHQEAASYKEILHSIKQSSKAETDGLELICTGNGGG